MYVVSMPKSLNMFLLYVDVDKEEKKKNVFKWVVEGRKKIIGARDNPIRFPQTMVPGNGGQQELCSTVLGTNEADKMNVVSDRSWRTFCEDKRESVLVLGLYHSKKCGCKGVCKNQ